MKQTQQTMACTGSLTPELEGASRTAAHPKRQAAPPPLPKKEEEPHE